MTSNEFATNSGRFSHTDVLGCLISAFSTIISISMSIFMVLFTLNHESSDSIFSRTMNVKNCGNIHLHFSVTPWSLTASPNTHCIRNDFLSDFSYLFSPFLGAVFSWVWFLTVAVFFHALSLKHSFFFFFYRAVLILFWFGFGFAFLVKFLLILNYFLWFGKVSLLYRGRSSWILYF